MSTTATTTEKKKSEFCNQWSYFEEVLHVKEHALKKAPAHTKKTKKHFVLPHMYGNIYTFTQRETHLVCQTNRKTFLLTGRDALRK